MPWAEGHVSTNGARLHYYRTGAGERPPIVLAHGVTDIADVWRVTAQALEPHYDVVLYDARGHGRSDKPASGYAPEDHAADLIGLVAALGLARPRLLGHSMGAGNVALAAATAPDLASCVLLEDPPWRPAAAANTPAEQEQFSAAWRADLLRWQAMSRAELLEEYRRIHPTWPEDEVSAWADAKLLLSPAVLGYVAALRPDWEATVGRIACPLLLITGDPELGAIVTPETAQRVAQLAPQARVARVDGAGHSIRRERRERYLAAVLGFLGERDGWGGA